MVHAEVPDPQLAGETVTPGVPAATKIPGISAAFELVPDKDRLPKPDTVTEADDVLDPPTPLAFGQAVMLGPGLTPSAPRASTRPYPNIPLGMSRSTP